MGASPLGIIGGLAGSMLSARNASRASDAFERANAMNREGWEMAKPYVKRLYEDGTSALDDMLAAGYYQGATYAGLNPTQVDAANRLSDFGNANAGLGQQFMNTAAGFGQNYADIYNRANQDSVAKAQEYALNNSQPLIDAAMMSDRRNLMENTLPGINRAASSSNNTNSSRAGIADAIANRAYDDRYAATAAGIQDKLMARSLTQSNQDLSNMMSANNALKNLFGIGFNLTPAALGYVGQGQGILQADAQNKLDASRQFFEGNRDYAYDKINQYGSGILGQAPRTPGASIQPNYFDPLTSGIMGGMQGFGMGNGMSLNGLFGGFGGGGIAPYNMGAAMGYTHHF